MTCCISMMRFPLQRGWGELGSGCLSGCKYTGLVWHSPRTMALCTRGVDMLIVPLFASVWPQGGSVKIELSAHARRTCSLLRSPRSFAHGTENAALQRNLDFLASHQHTQVDLYLYLHVACFTFLTWLKAPRKVDRSVACFQFHRVRVQRVRERRTVGTVHGRHPSLGIERAQGFS